MNTPTLFAAVSLIASALTGHAADASALWTQHCAKCHGPEGRGDTNMGKKLKIRDYTAEAVQAQFTDDAIAKAIKEGIKDEKGKTRMKAIDGLSDDDIAALVLYVRSLKK